MSAGTIFWWSDEADGWKVAMVLERMVRVRQVEGAPHPAFEIKLAGKQPFRREVTPDPGQTAWHALETELPFIMGVPGATGRSAPANPDIRRFMAAWEEYGRTGASTVACDACGERIAFEELSPTAWKSSCRCGKYSDTLRGM